MEHSYGKRSRSHAEPGRGTLVLVLGILSLVLCALLGPFAWIMGKGDLAKMERGQMDPTDRSTTNVGMICGIIGTVLLLLGLIISIACLALGFATTASGMGM